MRKFLFLLALLMPVTVIAENVYVVDRVSVGLYSGIARQEPRVKDVTSGEVLEVLEQSGNEMRVLTSDGIEGWIDANYVMTQQPAQLALKRVQGTLAKVKTELAESKQKLADNEAIIMGERQKVSTLAARLEHSNKSAEPAQKQKLSDGTGFQFSLMWLLISFAMLIVGLIAGIAWIKETNRRKLGGMHIKISGM